MQRFVGLVVGTASPKTIKVLRLKKNYMVHDPHEVAVIGDFVAIEYCGKISARKSFELTEIIKEARRYQHPITGQVYTAPAAHIPAQNWKEILNQ